MMFRALLIGVPEYGDIAFPGMPFIDNDLTELAGALTKSGYEVETHDRHATDSERIKFAIESFIVGAEQGETLLLYLSGHGVHYNGMDYLVPSTAMTASSRFPADMCVPIKCDDHISRSSAAAVLVVVDACREGVTLREKSVSTVIGWSDWQRDRSVARQVAYFYACSPGETAGFSRDGFSILSRALSQALLDPAQPSTVAELLKATQAKMNVLIAAHDVRHHTARVLSDVDQTKFVVVPRFGPTGEHDWVTAVRNHKIWESTDLREQTVSLVRDVAQVFPPDPWHDHTSFALRLSEKVRWLVCRVLNPTKLALSPADTALLVAFPFLHQAYWATLAHEMWPPNSPEFDRYKAGYPRLERRIAAAGGTEAEYITRWLFHRWLITRPESYVESRLPSFDGLIGEVFDPQRLMKMFRALRVDPTLLVENRVLLERRSIAASSDDEQDVHEQLLGFVLMAAYKFAIDPLDLPQVIVDHLGTGHTVDLAELATTLAKATWAPERRSRSLSATCTHQAVHHALKLHAESVNSLLVQIERIGPEPLSDMPSHANAELLQAKDFTEGFRFRLVEDRVQELLMGEQLYGDPALAVRELYQNALDACRYRDARTKYLVATGQPVEPWSGKIVFNQGLDEQDRPYLDCVDNGIGMGIRELTGLFANAGARFTTLPEFLEEQAHWREEGIELYPNSQFGIGVLSYFMLADEITVRTCRLDRDGKPGNELEVHVAGPGTLSRVRDLGQGRQAGTTIRLHLRKAVSCVDVLRRLLWVSEFEVTATDRSGSLDWTAGELSDHAPIGTDPSRGSTVRMSSHVDKTSQSGLWWCDVAGGILADGLWAGQSRFLGAVVNLTGPHTPRLTVDRGRIVEYDQAEVERLLQAGLPDLLAEDATVLTHDWLADLVTQNSSRLADLVHAELLRVGRGSWEVAGHRTSPAAIGCFPVDGQFFHRRELDGDNTYQEMPENVATWRLRAWVHAGHLSGLTTAAPSVLARPSDHILVTDLDSGTAGLVEGGHQWLEPQHPVTALQLIRAADRTGLGPRDIAVRLTMLGYRTPALAMLPTTVRQHDAYLVSEAPVYDGAPMYLDHEYTVQLGHMIAAAVRTGLSLVEVATRLTEFGYQVPMLPDLSRQLDADDGQLVSVELNGRRPWLEVDEPVPAGHVINAAVQLGLGEGDVIARLAAFGFATGHLESLPASVASDLVLLRDRNDKSWLNPREPVPPEHILLVADKLAEAPSVVLVRLSEFGYHLRRGTVSVGSIVQVAEATRRSVDDVILDLHELGCSGPEIPEFPHQLHSDDAILLSRFLNGAAPWLDPDEEVPTTHIIRASEETRLTARAVILRLWSFGFRTISEPYFLGRYEPTDLTLLSSPDPTRSWRDPNDELTMNDILRMAGEVELGPQRVAARYNQLGFETQPAWPWPEVLDRDDRIMISAESDGGGDWLSVDEPVPLAHLISVASETRNGPGYVARRMRALGYDVPTGLDTNNFGDREDEILLSVDLDGKGRWLDVTKPVPALHLIRIWLSGRDLGKAARRLVELGMKLPEGIGLAGD